MARAIQLEKPPIIEELPEAEEVEETEIAAVSAVLSGISYGNEVYVTSAEYRHFVTPNYIPLMTKEKEPEKTYLQLPKGKRVIILD